MYENSTEDNSDFCKNWFYALISMKILFFKFEKTVLRFVKLPLIIMQKLCCCIGSHIILLFFFSLFLKSFMKFHSKLYHKRTVQLQRYFWTIKLKNDQINDSPASLKCQLFITCRWRCPSYEDIKKISKSKTEFWCFSGLLHSRKSNLKVCKFASRLITPYNAD